MFVSKLTNKLFNSEITKNIESFGEFRYFENDKYWICFSENLLPDSTLEITFEVENANQDLSEKVILADKLLQNIRSLERKIYENIAVNFADKTIEELKTMWFLSSISLGIDDKAWKIVFEPDADAETIYNCFLRFTLIDEKIVWSNITRK